MRYDEEKLKNTAFKINYFFLSPLNLSFQVLCFSFSFGSLLLMFSECLVLSLFQENYTAPRMVLAASGVEHEELLSIAEPLFSDLPSVPRPEEPKSVYVGGDYRCQADSGVCVTICSFLLCITSNVSCLIDWLILFSYLLNFL